MDAVARVGWIAYANLAPLQESLSVPEGVECIEGVPTELNRKLQDGELDASFVSTVHWYRHRDQLERLPGIGIVSPAEVRSVILTTSTEKTHEPPASFYLTTASATSVALLQLLAVHHLRWFPAGRPLPTVTSPASAQARLLIGDEALLAAHEGRVPYIDLGAEWHAFTGLPMVWAVVCQRTDLPEPKRRAIARWHQSLLDAAAVPRRDAAADRVARQFQIPRAYVRDYFEGLQYSVENREEDGLARFTQLLVPAGNLPRRRPGPHSDEPVDAHRTNLR